MPIPPFDTFLNVLPPHLGDPTQRAHCSPYLCNIIELCARFATTDKRRQLLEGFLQLRGELFKRGVAGFQWLGGSFLEDIEVLERREPGDIDAVTFVANPANPADLRATLNGPPDLLSRATVKATYQTDHFAVSLGSHPIKVVDNARYWYGLFSHRRDKQWKGMIIVPLIDDADEADALKAVRGTP